MTDRHEEKSAQDWTFKHTLIVTIVPFVFVSAFVLTFPPHWMTIDDVLMNLTVAGLNGTPDEHVKWMHPVLGILLKNLYLSNQSMPWYGFFQLVLYSIGLSLILYSLLLSRKMAEGLTLFCLFLIVDIATLCQMQFTCTAFILAQGGFALLLAYAGCSAPTTPRHLLVLSTLALLVSYMVRWRVAEISLCITLAYLLLLNSKHVSHKAKEALITTVLIFAIGEGIHLGHVSFYETDPNWKGFFQWHELGNDYADFNRVKADEAALKKANWSRNDLSMMKSFAFLDASVFNNQTAGAVLSASKTVTSAKLSQEYIANEVQRLLLDPSSVISLAVLAVANFGLFSNGKDWLKNAFLLAAILAIDAILICLFKNPKYIFVPLWGFPLLASLVRAPHGFLPPKHKQLAFGALAFLCLSGALILEQNQTRKAKNHRLTLIREISNINPNRQQLYILLPFSLPISYISPFDNPLIVFKDMNLMTGSMIYSLDARQLERFGTNDFRKLISNPHVRFLANDYVDSANQVARFADEHYFLKIRMNPVYHCNELHYGVYKAEVTGVLQ